MVMQYRVVDVDVEGRGSAVEGTLDGPAAWQRLHALIVALEVFKGRHIEEIPRDALPVTLRRVSVK